MSADGTRDHSEGKRHQRFEERATWKTTTLHADLPRMDGAAKV